MIWSEPQGEKVVEQRLKSKFAVPESPALFFLQYPGCLSQGSLGTLCLLAAAVLICRFHAALTQRNRSKLESCVKQVILGASLVAQ